ncbi:MAG: pyridoxal 5'-phosphate synthase, partial [Pyrinomonadaceae bacterium]
ELERQVNIRGSVKRTSREESEAYFALRPVKSRIGAWASKQSSAVANREALEKSFADVQERFEGNDIPCPPFWGGFRVTPDRFEFWQGRRSRLHDRICYELEGGGWKISRLSP